VRQGVIWRLKRVYCVSVACNGANFFSWHFQEEIMYLLTPQRHALSWALLVGSAAFPCVGMAANAEGASATLAAPAQPALMLARVWQADQDPSTYWVSEKLDGVRAFWDGRVLRFRSGRVIAAPDWFIAGLPATPLDGELWLGRGQFDALSALVRRHEPVNEQWREVRYMIFDLPGASGTFTQRAQHIATLVVQAGQPWLQAVAQQRVLNAAALQSLLTQTVTSGGEGLVLHQAQALWSPGRSDALLKFKPMPDEDARVVSHLPGKGRHLGHMGALLLELPDGQRFSLGTGFTDAQRTNPPPIGTMVTYRFRDRTPKGLPKFASFMRVKYEE
jgi:DNA ligase-1